MSDKWGWEMWFSRFHIGIRDGVHNSTTMFPERTQMLGHNNYDLENHRWDLTHVCSMVPVARIGWALVVTILFGHSLVLFSYPIL